MVECEEGSVYKCLCWQSSCCWGGGERGGESFVLDRREKRRRGTRTVFVDGDWSVLRSAVRPQDSNSI